MIHCNNVKLWFGENVIQNMSFIENDKDKNFDTEK